MRLILVFALCLLAASPAMAEEVYIKKPSSAENPETIKDFANRYYQNCLKQDHPVLKGEDLQMLCACSSAQIVETMKVEDIKIMATDTPEGQKIRNFMTTNVYAPCMEYPTKALMMHSCSNDPRVQTMLQDPGEVCTCVAEGMGSYVAGNGKAVIEKSLAQDPTNLDPMGIFLASEEYRQNSEALLTSCLQKHLKTP